MQERRVRECRPCCQREVSPMEGGRARRSLAAVAAVVVLGFAVCCAIIAGWTAPQGGRAVLESLDADEAKVAGLTVAAPPCPRCVAAAPLLRPRRVCALPPRVRRLGSPCCSVLRIMQKLELANLFAKRAVDSFPDAPSEEQGFQEHDAFMRAHEGTQIRIAKMLDAEDKSGEPFRSDQARIGSRNEQNGFKLKALLAKEDADEKREMDATLATWGDRRQSLQDDLDYQEKMNGVLNAKADRTGEALVRRAKATTAAAEAVAEEERRANVVQLKRFERNMGDRQASLASQIVGLPDPGVPSKEERALLRQNIMSARALDEFK